MKNFIIKWATNTAGMILTANIVPGIHIANYKTAVMAALILGLLNNFIKPFIVIVTLPINILSLGIFTFFINTFFFYASSRLVEGFAISGFWSAFFGAMCFGVISMLLGALIGPFSKIEIKTARTERRASRDYPDAIDAEVVEPKDGGKDKKLLS